MIRAVTVAGRGARRGATPLALAGYVLAAVLLFSGSWFGPAGAIPGNGGDAGLFVWHLQWVPYALTHGLNPFVTREILYPQGANLMWNTSIFFPSLVLWPVTATLGPVVAFRVLMTAAVALSAWCAYLALRRYSRAPGAVAGGLLYGFSPYMMVHALGHANLAIAVFPPLVLLMLDDVLVRRRRPAWRSGGLLGVMAALQLLTGEEILLVTAAAAMLGAAVLALHARGAVRAALPHVVRVTGFAVASFAVVAGFPLWVQFHGPNQVHGLLHARDQYTNDLLSPFVPSFYQRGVMLGRLQDVNGETAAYLGIPLILLLAYACLRWWRRPEIRVAAIVGLTALVMSFGGVLHRNYRPTRFHGPFALFDHLPVIENLIPARFALFTYLMAALVVAVFVDRCATRRGWWRRPAAYATVIALAPLVPVLPFPSTTMIVPAYFQPGGAVDRLPKDAVVLVTPYYEWPAMVWQAASGFQFRLSNGTAYRPGPVYGPGITPLGGALGSVDADPSRVFTPSEVGAVVAELRQSHLNAVVVGPGPGHAGEVAFFSRVLHSQPQFFGGVAVWTDPNPS